MEERVESSKESELLESQTQDVIRRELEGKDVLIKTSDELGIGGYDGANYYAEVYFNEEMYQVLGKVVTVKQVFTAPGGNIVFQIKDASGWVYPIQAIKGIITQITDGTGEPAEVLTPQVGDLVKIKFDELKSRGTKGSGMQCKPTGAKKFQLPLMKLELGKSVKIDKVGGLARGKNEAKIGTEIIVRGIKDGVIIPYFVDGKYPNDIIKVEEVEVAEQGYVDKLKEKKRKKQAEKNILEDIEVMDEMISKVNKKDFIKIYAGCLEKTPGDIQGMDLLLNQWAFNKKHLYLLLGRELQAVQEIESEKDASAIKEDKRKLAEMFPGIVPVLRRLGDIEFKDNMLHDSIHSYDWTGDMVENKRYQSGTKVSKILNEAFDNDKLNTAYSDIISENKMRGFIEVSIDPIEILLMSTNKSGWESCHKISSQGRTRTWGSYSGGIFSYMCDKVSMIAFRHTSSKVSMKFYRASVDIWSKNWRQMVWISPDLEVFVPSRQYPTQSDETTAKVREMVEALIDQYKNNTTAWVHSKDQSKIKTVIADYNRLNKIELNTMHYNDMLHDFEGDLCYTKGKNIVRSAIPVGSNPACPFCGQNIMNDSSYPICRNCRTRL